MAQFDALRTNQNPYIPQGGWNLQGQGLQQYINPPPVPQVASGQRQSISSQPTASSGGGSDWMSAYGLGNLIGGALGYSGGGLYGLAAEGISQLFQNQIAPMWDTTSQNFWNNFDPTQWKL